MINIVLSSVLKPEYLNKDYKKLLLNVYKQEYETKSNNCGYIVKVNEIKDIISSMLNNNNDIIVESLCNCDIFKPEIDMNVECKIDMIHINGIFVSKYKIKILIPESSNNYSYKQNHFIYNKKSYYVNDNITIRIINIRYDKHTYSCIGKLI